MSQLLDQHNKLIDNLKRRDDIIQKKFDALSGTWYFSNFFFNILHDFLCDFTPPHSFLSSFTLQRKDTTRAIDLMT